MILKNCQNCNREYLAHPNKLFCSQKCGAAYRWKLKPRDTDKPRNCLVCGTSFFATPEANHQQICSADCRKKRNAQSVREWHLRNPEREAIYRERTKAKQMPETNLIRFRRNNPDAPSKCESCGDHRVLDIAHKPGFERNGAGRSVRNCKWPEMVWVLCPTCHALHDRMHYSVEELGLTI